MTFLTSALNLTGIVLLIHAVYSSYEHSILDELSSGTTTSTLSTRNSLPLPLDIIVETLVSVLLLCTGVVLGSAQLKPIQMSDWAGQLERSKDARKLKAFGDGGPNPYAQLEERPGFRVVRGARDGKI